jgi:conjugative relaxase-like TrwC/TraI family protein
MLSIPDPGKSGGSSGYYWRYYNQECVESPWWFGTGAEIFQLQGEVRRGIFENLDAGRDPYGAYDLVKNAGHPDRDTHWDLTFSAPKSVSVLYALGSDEVRKEIVEAHKFAVKKALEYIEQNAAITRRGKGGTIREHCAIIGCCFPQDVSREHDMQIHTHAILFNAGIRPDGSTGALHSIELFRHKHAAGNVYQAELARQMTQRFGVVMEKEKVGFHVQGVPKELCRENSTRRQQIEEALKKAGLEGPVASKKIAEQTRAKKKPMDREELLKKWQEKCESFGWGQKEAAQLIEQARIRDQDSRERGNRLSTSERKADDSKLKERREVRSESKEQQPAESKPKENNKEQDTAGKKSEQSKSEEKTSDRKESNQRTTRESKSQEQRKEQGRPQKQKIKKGVSEKARLKLEKKKIKAFRRHFTKAVNRIYVENQTVERVMKVAHRLAEFHGVNTDTILKAVKDAKLPHHLGWGRIEYRKLFPKAHSISPFSKLKLPVLALRDKPRKWGAIEKKVVLGKFLFHQHEFRIQQKNLFPGAPKWSPLHKVSFPALRFVAKWAESKPKTYKKQHSNKQIYKFRHEH